jgi:hypothetical protein
MEGLTPKVPDSYKMFLLWRSTILKAKKRPTELGHYTCKVLRANELPYMVALLKDSLSYLTSVIGNLLETATFLGNLRDEAAVKKIGSHFLQWRQKNTLGLYIKPLTTVVGPPTFNMR